TFTGNRTPVPLHLVVNEGPLVHRGDRLYYTVSDEMISDFDMPGIYYVD
ncbi:unnamed protein product, partial [Pylaiella littoralis]